MSATMARRIKLAEFNQHIRGRQQLVDPQHEKILTDISQKREIVFLPNSVISKSERVTGQYAFRFYVFGVMPDGSKACVILNNIDIYFDVLAKTPIDEAIQSLKQKLIKTPRPNNKPPIKFTGLTKEVGYRAMEFTEHPMDWIRIHFSSIWDRSEALKFVHSLGYETAIDDEGDKYTYFRIVARTYKFNTCNWNRLPAGKYSFVSGSASTLDITLMIDVGDFLPLGDEEINRRGLTKDKTLVMRWDTELYKYDDDGEVTRANDNPKNYIIFMICLVFYWQYSPDCLLAVCLTDMPADTIEVDQLKTGCPTYIVECSHRAGILDAFIHVIGRMKPDILDAFNGGNFDTPILIEQIKAAGKLPQLFEALSCIRPSISEKVNIPENNASESVWQQYKQDVENVNTRICKEYFHRVDIKISPEETFNIMVNNIPGIVDTDTMVIFKQLYTRAEVGRKYSLNFYLAKNKLGSKADMPYKRMFRIYELSRLIECMDTCPQCKIQIPAIRLVAGERQVTLDIKLEEALASYHAKWYTDENRPACICQWRTFIRHEMSFVAHYCFIDAISLQSLNLKRMTLNDRRELSNMSFLPLYDSYYRANGMKVRNLIAAMGINAGIKVSAYRDPGRKIEDRKYPGAWVFPPRKGLENKRPVTGLDFSSLYPSLMMTYNLSPDKVASTKERANELAAKGYQLHKIEFTYKGTNDTVIGWSVRHRGIHTTTCCCEHCLAGDGICPNDRKNLRVIVGYKTNDAGEYIRVCGKRVPIYGESPLPGETMGIFSYVLKILFDRRAVIKKQLIMFVKLKEKFDTNAPIADDELLAAGIKREELTAEELEFRIAATDSKQKAMKVHMNTFYGESGNKLSPMYIVQIAGGVTAAGQYNIKKVEQYLKDRNYTIHYGDTDSVYISCPPEVFADLDAEYKSALDAHPENRHHLTLDYWTKMVKRTRIDINALRNKVADHLTADNGTEFLNMAYEEVLFPVFFAGKKKYFGFAHMETENFEPEDKDIFIRGVDIIKQGQSELAKVIGYEIIRELLSVDNVSPIIDLITNKLKSTYSRQWATKYFIVSGKYKPEKNNVPIHKFVRRMVKMQEMTHDPMYTPPDPGDPFKFVVVKRDQKYDLTGKKLDLKKGDLMEYVEVFEASKKTDAPMEIDLNYYTDSSIINLLARLISAEPQFLPTSPMEFEEADIYSCDQAENFLRQFRNTLTGYNAERERVRGRDYRKIYKGVSKLVRPDLVRRIGGASTFLYDIDLFYDDPEHSNADILIVRIEEYIKSHYVQQDTLSGMLLQRLLTHENTTFGQWYDLLVVGDKRLTVKRRAGELKLQQLRMSNRMDSLRNKMREVIVGLPETICDYKISLENIIYRYRHDIDVGTEFTLDDSIVDHVNNLPDDSIRALTQLYELYLEYTAAYTIFQEAAHMHEAMMARMGRISGVYNNVTAVTSTEYRLVEETPFV